MGNELRVNGHGPGKDDCALDQHSSIGNREVEFEISFGDKSNRDELYVGSTDGGKYDCQVVLMIFWVRRGVVTEMETSRGIIIGST